MVIREIIRASTALTVAIIDLKRMPPIDAMASRMLFELVVSLAGHGKQLVFTHAESHPRFKRLLEEAMSLDDGTRVTTFPELDLALEWCEARLITQHAPALESVGLVHPSNQQLCKDLKVADVTHLKSVLVRERFDSGDLIIRREETADKLYFLMCG